MLQPYAKIADLKKSFLYLISINQYNKLKFYFNFSSVLTLTCVLRLTSGSLLQLKDFSGFDGRGTFFFFATPTGAPGGGGGGGARGPLANGGPPGGGGGAGGGGIRRGGAGTTTAGGTTTPGVRGGPPGTQDV